MAISKTTPRHLVQRRLSAHRGARRLWLEGRRLTDVGFKAGVRYQATVAQDSIVLRLTPAGDHKVSQKQGRPVVDLLTRKLGAVDRIEVRYSPREILVRVHPLDIAARDRLVRLNGRLAAGEHLRLGSVCHGGGVATDALLRGLGKARLAFAIEQNEDYLAQSLEHNPAWRSDTLAIEADLGDLGVDPASLALLPEVEVLEAGLPCVAASRAGRSKKHLGQPEDDAQVADLAHAFLNVVAATRPAVILLENVPEYATSASAQEIRRALGRLGYDLHEVALDGAAWSLEARDRWVLVAVTHGLDLDPSQLVAHRDQATLGEVLDRRVSADRWRTFSHLAAKETRDQARGSRFKQRVLGPQATSVPTLRRGYQKAGSTDPRLAHPTRAGYSRLSPWRARPG